MNIILASTSTPRTKLLQQVCSNFTNQAPNVDETQHPQESPYKLVQRLALSKAQVVANSNPNAIVIGADQVAHHQGKTQGKLTDFTSAHAWLSAVSGKKVEFISGMAIISPTKTPMISTTTTYVTYRNLSSDQITHYLNKEKPYAAAGAMHIEGLGICLASHISSEDPSAMLGLSLTKLSLALHEIGVDLLQDPK